MSDFLTKTQLAELQSKYETIPLLADQSMLSYAYHKFKSPLATEFASHGFSRRVQTLRRCLDNVFKIVPPSSSKVPSRAKLHDAQINIQAFFANAYGSVDNLAWIWAHETGLTDTIDKRRIGLRKHHVEVRNSLSVEFREYLKTLEPWFDYLVEYRDALAHRIPLYIPPGAVRSESIDKYNYLWSKSNAALGRGDVASYKKAIEEINELLVFQPWITHSVTETTAHYAFHVQMVCDFLTVEELGRKMLAELASRLVIQA